MSKTQAIANRLREVLLNGKWVANTNFKEQISSVSWEQAIEKVSDLNTIALLTFHINYYLVGIINVFEGGSLDIKDKYSFDMPSITSAEDWNNLITEFLKNSETFVSHVEQMPDTILDTFFVDQKYGTYSRNLECVIEHSYYHLGQVVMLRKLLKN